MKQIALGELKVPAVALGTWSWGYGGIAGGDSVFGNRLSEAELGPVFDYAMSKGLTLWDTATVYASGASEKILGEFVKDRADAIVSTKFTPVLAQGRGDEAMEEFFAGQPKDASQRRDRYLLDTQHRRRAALERAARRATKIGQSKKSRRLKP